ncbi:uncharacterized protein LOC118503805 isoform X1 [Anopheles stephensi]|uniref:uncharacterized protein LOC118503805 isoform X1 n=1 Tax=Anopheles stephensi TaxID=30069 RepID=UPI001658B53A|nr:uncharacterized protein LOC118503805 isoform X1 [Anopheles stephensi]XP_035893393.1 uncharacterized protein LOC118503805 isoform X1 [Anopheles stephensi]XP_035893394.1 uncharacterized protein LOC118503805 isoform X1 [Anopheles stephensi]
MKSNNLFSILLFVLAKRFKRVRPISPLLVPFTSCGENMAQISILVALCACCVIIVRTDATLYPIIKRYEIRENKQYVNATVEEVGDYEFNRTYLLRMEALREIRDLKGGFSYSIRAFDGAIQSALLSRSFDLCEFIRRPNSNRLVKMYYDLTKRNSNVPNCPYLAGYIVTLNITATNFPIPGFIPETDYMIETKIFTRAGTMLILETRWYGSLVKYENVHKFY